MKIVTVTNENPINRNALLVLLSSFQSFERLTDTIFVLTTRDSIPPAMNSKIKSLGGNCIFFPKGFTDDPYKNKFLIQSFIQKHKNYSQGILYLDPDHVFLNKISLPSNKKGLFVSSEVSTVSFDFRDQVEILLPHHTFLHYNTSLIYGQVDNWLKAGRNWESTYEEIKQFVQVRHREEIAFSLSACLSNIPLLPVSTFIQSNFKLFETNSTLFHYGGESNEARIIKSCLKDISTIKENLERVSNSVDMPQARWLAEKMLDILSYGDIV